MSKEFTPRSHNFKIAGSDNCFAESIATISRFYNRRCHLNGFRLAHRLPEPNDYYLSNLFVLLENYKITNLSHDLIEIPPSKTLFFRTIKQAILGGALCEIGVKSTPWIRTVIGENYSSRSNHSVVIYGYYQPNEDVAKGFFYIVDPWQDKKIFVKSNAVFETTLKNPGIAINLFNHCLDHAGLVHQFGIKNSQIDPKAQRAIMNRSPHEATDKKRLASLFKK